MNITITITKEDIWWLRNILDNAIQYMETHPNPAAFSRSPEVARKMVRKLNKAAKKAFGHDLHADATLTAKADARRDPATSEGYLNEGPR